MSQQGPQKSILLVMAELSGPAREGETENQVLERQAGSKEFFKLVCDKFKNKINLHELLPPVSKNALPKRRPGD